MIQGLLAYPVPVGYLRRRAPRLLLAQHGYGLRLGEPAL